MTVPASEGKGEARVRMQRRSGRGVPFGVAAGAWLLACFSIPSGTALAGEAGRSAPNAAEAAPGASAPARAEVVVLYATSVDGGGSIDPRIERKLPLSERPFSSYNTYRRLTKTVLSLPNGRAVSTVLPNGRTLELTLKNAVDADRFRVAVRVTEAGGGTFLPLFEVTASATEPFYIAGQAYRDGVLFVGMAVLR